MATATIRRCAARAGISHAPLTCAPVVTNRADHSSASPHYAIAELPLFADSPGIVGVALLGDLPPAHRTGRPVAGR